MSLTFFKSLLFAFIFIHSPLSSFAQESSLDSEIPKTKEDLLIDLKDLDSEVRAESARTLGATKTKDLQVSKALIKSLGDPDPDVRADSAWALGFIGSEDIEVIKALTKLLIEDKNPLIKLRSIEALGKIKARDIEVLDALVTSLKDKNSMVRRGSAWALGEIGYHSPKVLKALTETVRDEVWLVRKASLEALEKMKNKVRDENILILEKAQSQKPKPPLPFLQRIKGRLADHLGKAPFGRAKRR